MSCRRSTVIALAAIGGLQLAAAADLPTKEAPPAPPPPAAWSWTGVYAGVEGGGVWGSAQTVHGPIAPAPSLNETNPFGISGGIFGDTLGYNYQFRQVVLGAEGDISWSPTKGTGADIPPFSRDFSQTANEQWLSTLRGRVGYAWGDVLLYGTGGVALANVQQKAFDNPPVCGPGTAFPCVSIAETQNLWGWALGAGVEWRFFQNFSLKAEYLFVDLPQKSYFNPAPTSAFAVFNSDQRLKLNDNIVRLGLNYHFN
jgi:outer membrane immunogenic protein